MKKVDYLPLGTVCSVKKSDVKVMVVGYLSIKKDNKTLVYYKVVLYPAGILSYEKSVIIDSKNIKEVLFTGYEDIKFKAFKFGMNSALDGIKFDNIFKENEI